MKRYALVLVAGLLATSVAGLTGGSASAATPTDPVQPTPAAPISLPAPTTTSTAAQRNIKLAHFGIGSWDKILPTGNLFWLPASQTSFDTVYGYATGTGPGTKS